MATIQTNVDTVVGAITAQLDQNPMVRYAVEDGQRPGQDVGKKILVMHRDHLTFESGAIWVGSTVLQRRGKRTVQPQAWFDNLLEVTTSTAMGPKYMPRWLDHNLSMEPNYRQAKPEAKIRIESLATTFAAWARVLVDLTPEVVVEVQKLQRERAERDAAAEQARQEYEVKEALLRARREAREKLYADTASMLLREYGDFVYTGSAYGSYTDDQTTRAQRARVQASAGFRFAVESREVEGAEEPDGRPWVDLDGSYCKSFSLGEARAMLDALKAYRATTPQEEWLPRADQSTPLVLQSKDEDEPEEPEVSMELNEAMLLGVPLPDSWD